MWNSVDGGCLWPIEEICRRWFAAVAAVHVKSGFKFSKPFVFLALAVMLIPALNKNCQDIFGHNNQK